VINKTRTIALKIAAFLVIMILLNLLARMSESPSQWWHMTAVILNVIFIMFCMLIMIAGQVRETKNKDDDLLDNH
jgi:Na+/melibiose symporter-like transporter